MVGCKKEPKIVSRIAGVETDYDLALPLIQSTFDMERILQLGPVKAFVQKDPDKLVRAVYENRVFSLFASNLINIDDQNFSLSNNIPTAAATAFNSGLIDSITISGSNDWTYQYPSHNQFELDSIWFKTGQLQLSISSPIPHHVRVRITLHSLREQGKSVTFLMSGDYQGSSPLQISNTLNLDGKTADLTLSSQGFNQFKIDYTITLVRASSTPVVAGSPISFTGNARNIKFAGLFGYLGQFEVNIPRDSVELGIFRNYRNGRITLADPYVRLRVLNSMGVSLGGNFDALYGSSRFAGTKSIFGAAIPNPLTVKRPDNQSLGLSVNTDFEADKNNSNLQSVVNDIPRFIVYSMKLRTNPNGKIEKNFVLDTSRIFLEALVKIPMWGTASDFDLQDTGQINLPDPVREVESATLRLNITNGFPLEAKVQVYFLDSAFNLIDSALTQSTQIIESGQLDGQGKVVVPVRKTTDMELTQERWRNLLNKRASRIIIKGGFNTTAGGTRDVKFYSDYFLKINVGVRTKIKAYIAR